MLRQIEKDLNKLARRRNERERAKKRKDQKEAKDSDRAQSCSAAPTGGSFTPR